MKVARPPFSRFRWFTRVVAISSFSTTTWKSWLPAVTSTAAFSGSMHVKSSMKGPYTPLNPQRSAEDKHEGIHTNGIRPGGCEWKGNHE